MLQQARTGGINLCTISKASLYHPTATHVIEIDTEKCIEKGIFFFGNLFTDVVMVHGKMVSGMEKCLLSVCGSVAENDMGSLGKMIESFVVKNQCLIMFVRGLD